MNPLELQVIKIGLGREVYEIDVLNHKDSNEWFKTFELGFRSILNQLAENQESLGGVVAMAAAASKDAGDTQIDFGSAFKFFNLLISQLGIAFEQAPGLVKDYLTRSGAPVKAEHIERASTAQIMYALAEMVKAETLTPFLMMRRIQPGR